jgi:hypothetical protein
MRGILINKNIIKKIVYMSKFKQGNGACDLASPPNVTSK